MALCWWVDIIWLLLAGLNKNKTASIRRNKKKIRIIFPWTPQLTRYNRNSYNISWLVDLFWRSISVIWWLKHVLINKLNCRTRYVFFMFLAFAWYFFNKCSDLRWCFKITEFCLWRIWLGPLSYIRTGSGHCIESSKHLRTFKVCIVNVNTLKGWVCEPVVTLSLRKVDHCCVQDTRYYSGHCCINKGKYFINYNSLYQLTTLYWYEVNQYWLEVSSISLWYAVSSRGPIDCKTCYNLEAN